MALCGIFIFVSIAAIASGAIIPPTNDCQAPDRIALRVGRCFVRLDGGRWLLGDEALGIGDTWRQLVGTLDKSSSSGHNLTVARSLMQLVQNGQELMQKAKTKQAVRRQLCTAAHDLMHCAREEVLESACASYYEDMQLEQRQKTEASFRRLASLYSGGRMPALNLLKEAVHKMTPKISLDSSSMLFCAICEDDTKLQELFQLVEDGTAGVLQRIEAIKADPLTATYEMVGRCGNDFGRAMSALRPTGDVDDACEVEPAVSCVARFAEEKLLLESENGVSLLEKYVKIVFSTTFDCPVAERERQCATEQQSRRS